MAGRPLLSLMYDVSRPCLLPHLYSFLTLPLSVRVSKLVSFFQCSTGAWRSLERFSAASVGMIQFASNFNFKAYVAEVLLLVYNIANLSLLVAPGAAAGSTAEGFATVRREMIIETSAGAFPSRLFRLPFLRADAHHMSMGMTKLSKSPAVSFFLAPLARGRDEDDWPLLRPRYCISAFRRNVFFLLRFLQLLGLPQDSDRR